MQLSTDSSLSPDAADVTARFRSFKIAFIGGGNMASALIGGLIKHGMPVTDLYAIDTATNAREALLNTFGIRTGVSPDAALCEYDALVLAVKPQVVKEVAHALIPHLNKQLVISIAAGIRAADLSHWLDDYPKVVRSMPNTPALIGQGMTGMVALAQVDACGRSLAQQVLSAVGDVIWCEDESQIDAITAISGSGPAYVFYFIEALEEAACQLGLNQAQSRALTLATFKGASLLAAQADQPISVLRERVTSKGGTTAAALASFAQDQVKKAIMRGVFVAHTRAAEIANETGAGG